MRASHHLTIAFLAIAIAAILGCSSAQESGESGESGGSAVIGFYGAPDAGPAPLEVHFHPHGEDAVVSAVTTWAWDFGDGATSDEQYTTHAYDADGAYSVTLKVTTSGGDTHKVTRVAYIKVGAGQMPTEEEEGGEGEQEERLEEEEMGEETETAPETQSEATGSGAEAPPAVAPPVAGNGLVFIHHSCGEHWLNSGLHRALLAKPYIDDRNDITYGTELDPDPGRPRSLGSPAGDLTDMHHWIRWFNDYLHTVRTHGGGNRIVMFKSCFPNSHIDDDGAEPGEPFGDWKATANYKAVFRHPVGPGNTYQHDGHTYRALQDVFARCPDTLFIYVTAPPEGRNETNAPIAGRARRFNNWLTHEWLPAYTQATGLHNVAVFDWFDLLATPIQDSAHANQLRQQYGGTTGDSHPNGAANARSTEVFATGSDNFLDEAWEGM